MASLYGSFKPHKAPDVIKAHAPNPAPLAQLEDVRHYEDTPMPWLRYFFPKDFDVREGCETFGPYQQYFDVHLSPVQDDSAVPPPAWAPNAYFRLSFTQQQWDPKKTVDVPGRQVDLSSPLLSAADITAGGGKSAALYREGTEKHRQQILTFCRHVASFKPRIWRDALPLVDLLRGVLLYLVENTEAGVQLAKDYALRDALAAQEADRKLVREQAAEELARMRETWDEDAAANAAALKEQLRKQLADELAGQMRSINEERERWAQKAAAGEATIKRLTESESALERKVAALEAQLESQRSESERVLAEKTAQAEQVAEEVAEAQEALFKARKCILDALQARTKTQVISCAMEAIRCTMPGTNAYVAEVALAESSWALHSGLGGVSAADGEGSVGLAAVRRAADTEGPEGPVATGLASITPSLLRCPISAGVLPGKNTYENVQDQLALQYVAASPGQEFVLGSSLSWPLGVSWPVVGQGAEVHVPDVTQKDGVCFLRPHGSPTGGSYLAVPIRGSAGEVVGLLGLDTVQHAGGDEEEEHLMLGEEDAEFVRQLAALISGAVAGEQHTLSSLIDQVSGTSSALAGATPDAGVPADPERYADLTGGKKLLKDAIAALKALSDAELAAFQSQETPSEATLAVTHAVLAAAGQVSDGDWSSMRSLLSRGLLDKLSGLDPEAAWAEWQRLCSALQPVLQTEAHQGASLDVMLGDTSALEAEGAAQTPEVAEAVQQLQGSVSQSLGRWLAAVRKISAALELRRAAEEQLARANASLLHALTDSGGGKAGSKGSGGEGGSNALQELRSYRVPPKHSFTVLQAVLQLTNHSEDDCRNWGRMRVLTSYKLVKQLTELKPASIVPKVLSGLRRGIRDLDEVDVRKESVAALALFRWLRQFLRCGELTHA